jgi:hypothetical protein
MAEPEQEPTWSDWLQWRLRRGARRFRRRHDLAFIGGFLGLLLLVLLAMWLY